MIQLEPGEADAKVARQKELPYLTNKERPGKYPTLPLSTKTYAELRDALVFRILLFISVGQKLILIQNGGFCLFHAHEKYGTVPLRLAHWLLLRL